jgi:hypothetical protein
MECGRASCAETHIGANRATNPTISPLSEMVLIMTRRGRAGIALKI